LVHNYNTIKCVCFINPRQRAGMSSRKIVVVVMNHHSSRVGDNEYYELVVLKKVFSFFFMKLKYIWPNYYYYWKISFIHLFSFTIIENYLMHFILSRLLYLFHTWGQIPHNAEVSCLFHEIKKERKKELWPIYRFSCCVLMVDLPFTAQVPPMYSAWKRDCNWLWASGLGVKKFH
jgi:hypothetical protein